MPSPAVLGLNGSVPSAISTALVRPSLSSSPSGLMMRRVFAADGTWLELPEPLVATSVNEPATLGAMERLRVAEVPVGSAVADVITTLGGTVTGWKAKVAVLRAAPVTTKLEIKVVEVLVTANFGLTDKTAGDGMKIKFLSD